jgi:hypothetical protein
MGRLNIKTASEFLSYEWLITSITEFEDIRYPVLLYDSSEIVSDLIKMYGRL